MKKLVLTAAIIVATTLAPAPAYAGGDLGIDPQQANEAMLGVDAAMAENIDDIVAQLEKIEGPIVVIPYICPHLIEALGRIGNGEIESDQIGASVVSALMDDRKMAAQILFATGKAPTMEENGLSMQISLRNQKAAGTMIEAAKYAQAFLARQ